MNILQDILGLFKRRKIVKTLQSNDYIPLGTFKSKKEALKPNPKMETVLISAESLKAYIAAGIDPGYKTYTALLTQSGTNPPSVTVLKNEIGNIVWGYDIVGAYDGLLLGGFPQNKTTIIASQYNQSGFDITTTYREDDDYVYVETYKSGNQTNGILFETMVEIRIYA